MSAARSFPSHPQAAAAARNYAVKQCEGVDAAVAETVRLMVSELATNAIRHARTSFRVTVTRDDRTIRVTVTDFGGGQPHLEPVDPKAEDGRGLQIVHALSDRWGVDYAHLSKTIWFVLADTEPS